MAIDTVTNPPSVQTNLTALANTASLLQKTEQQLATGKSVNSPSDNATAYYAAQGLLQQANDLSNVKDNLSTSLTTVNATNDAIGSVTQVVQQLQGITTEAAGTTDPTTRANLAQQYNNLLPQLNQLVSDLTFNGVNLLNGGSNSLTVNFNSSNTAGLTIASVDATSSGLGTSAAQNGFASSADISAANTQLQGALSTLSSDAAGFGGNATLIQTNQDFASNLINNLQSASDNLTVSDPDQDGADLLALQAQNQLGIVSLNISGQLAQSVLKLFE